MKIHLIIVAIFFLLNISCTRDSKKPTTQEKQRGLKHVFAQGIGSDIYNIKQFQVIKLPSDTLQKNILTNKAIQIKTASVGKKAKISVSSYGTAIDSNSKISFINQYYHLDYKILNAKTDSQKILSRLLGNIKQFKGFPDTTYHIVPHLEGNYLILYRVSDSKKLPFDERAISVKIGDQIGTPLVGYPVKYCVAEKILNSYNQETKQNRLKCDNDITIDKATYVRIQESQKKVFQYQPKIDIFPRDFFKGEWFFAKTYIKSSHNNLTGFHGNFSNAELIEFVQTPHRLQVVDASGYQIKEKDKVTNFFIPIEWKEYEIARDSNNMINQFSERENTKSIDTARPFFKINFEKLAQRDLIAGVESVGETDNIFITDNYFSFVIKISGDKNVWIKYAFKKRDTNNKYVEKQWLREDSTKYFPIFNVFRKYHKTNSFHSQKDTEKFLRVTRFNSKAQDNSVQVLKWYFSKQTVKDERIRLLARKAIQYWDTVFQQAGKDSKYKIRIVLDESEEKELGDLRYNIINILPSLKYGYGYAGLGPNISNPITGEILFSTTNIILSAVVDPIITKIRKYIRFNIYPSPWELSANISGVSKFLDANIKKECHEVTKFISDKLAEGVKNHPSNQPLADTEIIKNCAEKISESTILHVIMHELGHNFGYRHMFSASADKNNFYKSYDEIKNIFGQDTQTYQLEDFPMPPQYSSVMDYINSSQPRLPVPGKYDIAITRYSYFNKIELQTGEFLNIPDLVKDSATDLHQKNITEIAQDKNGNIKKYKVCGGDLVGDYDPKDPLCTKWDYGSTPLEILNNYIIKIENNIMLYKQRYDSEHFDVYGIKRDVQSMLALWNKWKVYRDDLLTSHNKSIKEYLFTNSAQIKEYQDLIYQEAQSNPEFKKYYDLREPLFAFYKKIFFLPSKKCIYKKDDKYEAISFYVITKQVKRDYTQEDKEVITDCQSPAILKWAIKNKKGTFITEVGYAINSRSYFVQPSVLNDIDELSMFSNTIVQPSVNDPIINSNSKPKQKVTNSIWRDFLVFVSGTLLREPDFLQLIVEERLEQLLTGRDFNLYIHDKTIKVPNRLLSYVSDLLMVSSNKFISESLLHAQSAYAEQLVYSAKNYKNISEEDLTMFHEYKGALSYTNEIVLGKVLEQDLAIIKIRQPFIYSVLQEYKKTHDTKDGFMFHLLNHPSVCISSSYSILMPYVDNNQNSYYRICNTFNVYKKCIKNNSETPCEDLEEKKGFVSFVNIKMQVE